MEGRDAWADVETGIEAGGAAGWAEAANGSLPLGHPFKMVTTSGSMIDSEMPIFLFKAAI